MEEVPRRNLARTPFRCCQRDYCKEGPCNFPWGGVLAMSLTKSWPTFEQLCVQNIALAISYCFFSYQKKRTKSGWLEVDQGVGQTVGPTFDTKHFRVEIEGFFLALVLWQHPTLASPCFCTLLNRVGNKKAFRLPGEGGDHFHCTVGTFARSYLGRKSIAIHLPFVPGGGGS